MYEKTVSDQTINTRWSGIEEFEAHYLILKIHQPHTYADVGMVLNHLGIILRWNNEERTTCRLRVSHQGIDEIWVVSSPKKLTKEILDEWASLFMESRQSGG